MKKKILSNLFLIMSLLILAVMIPKTEASQGGRLLKYEENLMNQISYHSNSEFVQEIIIVPENYPKEEVLNMIERVAEIHPSILKKVVNNNLKLKLFTGSLTDQPGFTHLKGVKPKGYVRYTWDDVPGAGGAKIAHAKIGKSNKGNGHNSVNLELHELAHTIDRHVYHSIRTEPLFIEIWKEEASLLFPGQHYFIDHPEEYFAETFAMYFLGFSTRSELSISAPKTFHYLAGLQTRDNGSMLDPILFLKLLHQF